MKLNDLNIFELFKSDDNDKDKNNEGNNILDKLEKIASKIKLTSEKVSKVEDGVTYLTEYEVTVDNNKISTSETGNVYQTSDTVPEQQDFTIY